MIFDIIGSVLVYIQNLFIHMCNCRIEYIAITFWLNFCWVSVKTKLIDSATIWCLWTANKEFLSTPNTPLMHLRIQTPSDSYNLFQMRLFIVLHNDHPRYGGVATRNEVQRMMESRLTTSNDARTSLGVQLHKGGLHTNKYSTSLINLIFHKYPYKILSFFTLTKAYFHGIFLGCKKSNVISS